MLKLIEIQQMQKDLGYLRKYSKELSKKTNRWQEIETMRGFTRLRAKISYLFSVKEGLRTEEMRLLIDEIIMNLGEAVRFSRTFTGSFEDANCCLDELRLAAIYFRESSLKHLFPKKLEEIEDRIYALEKSCLEFPAEKRNLRGDS